MDEILKQRLLRHIEALPEDKAYQVLDYIEFISSKYADRAVSKPNGVQSFGERLQDKLRAKNVGISAVQGTMKLVSGLDKTLSKIQSYTESTLKENSERTEKK